MSDFETTQRRRNIVVGIFVVLGVCALVWLVFKFGDLPGTVSKHRSFQVYVQFPSAPGVEKDTPVRFCGYEIGRVTDVMAPEIREDLDTLQEYHQAVVVLSIKKKYVNIPSNVQVKLMTRGLGSSYIELRVDPAALPAPPRDPNRPETRFLASGMWLQGSTGATSEFFPEESQRKLDELINGLGQFIVNANDIIGDEDSKQNVRTALANLTEASEQLKLTIEEFRELAVTGKSTLKNAEAKVDEVVSAVVDTSEEIQKFTSTGTSTLKSFDAKAERLVVALVDTSEQLSGAMEQLRLILEKVNNGQGTVGKLLNDGRFYENLLENTEQVQMLLEEMKAFVAEWREKEIKVTIF